MGGVCFPSLILILVAVPFVLATTDADGYVGRPPLALRGCSSKCGNVTIPYPFGMSPGCYRGPEFFINCTNYNPSTARREKSLKPYLMMKSHGEVELSRVTDISLRDGELHVSQQIIKICGDNRTIEDTQGSRYFLPSPFTLSDAKNNFFGIGCDTGAILQGHRTGLGGRKFRHINRGCWAYCVDYQDDDEDDDDSGSFSTDTFGNDTGTKGNNNLVIPDDSCSGFACCQVSIPAGLQNFSVSGIYSYVSNWTESGKWHSKYPCRYAFVVEQSGFRFSPNTSFEQLNNTTHLPVVVNWEIGDHATCEIANKTKDFACKANSKCITRPRGYICNCSDGYEGNPYHPNGCQDIDECKIKNLNHCALNKCVNTVGSFTCMSDEPPPPEYESKTILAVVVAVATVLLVGTASSLYWGLKQRKYIKLKEKYFQENGGFLLQHKLASHHGVETTRIFTAEELDKATNNYHDSSVLGKGSYGIVYKGILPDNKMVAIKKSIMAAQTQSEQFVNELVVLSQINHRNVVRLLGCCLESEVPLLVYEFITNGTLFEHIHGDHERSKKSSSSLAWESRLKIATETAGALAYLHSSTFMQIIHRDVKAMNILLDDNYTAKVSDFGASVLIPLEKTQIKTFVQGTLGYLDPEYLQSNQLTEKSDVYSFGVVLAELLTSKVAFCYERPEAERSLARMFVCAMEEERLIRIVDDGIVEEGNMESVRNVACLAYRCLRLKGAERPTMREVATELEGMRILASHPWAVYADLRPEDWSSLLIESSSSTTSGSDVKGDCGSSGTPIGKTSRSV